MHWFDAPGMIQRFSFSNGNVSHKGRLIDTARNAVVDAAGGIRLASFGTRGPDLTTGGSADAQNPGNISLIEHAGELLSLWEGGSPHVINPSTLQTEGHKSWSTETEGLPFGAHPRVDKDGSIWNVGYSVNPAALILSHISAQGQMPQTHVLPQTATPMVHDFLITDTKIVILAPPYTSSNREGSTFVDLFEWDDTQPTQAIVIDKDDLSSVTQI